MSTGFRMMNERFDAFAMEIDEVRMVRLERGRRDS